MTTKEYLNKYRLNLGIRFNRSQFINDLMIDFLSLLELNKADDNIKGFNNAVNALKMKFDAINNKTSGDISKMWNYIFATKIVSIREEICPTATKQREERQKYYEERRRQREREDRYWEEFIFNEHRRRRKFFEEFLSGIEFNLNAQLENREILGIDKEIVLTKEIIMTKYRELVKIHHPDKGGKQEDFIKITNAKNILLSRV